MNQEVAEKQINRFENGIWNTVSDKVAVEEPLEISLKYAVAGEEKSQRVSITMRTPGNDVELATGFLFTEGIINGFEEVNSSKHLTNFLGIDENRFEIELSENSVFDLSKLQRNFYTTSSCGVCGKASIDAIKTTNKFMKDSAAEVNSVSSEIVLGLPNKLRKIQETFELTGGLHASGLFNNEGEIVAIREDVGRHNALDKLIGFALKQNILPLSNHILLLSGRASFELLQKSAMAGIQIICAVGAPSSLAIETAEEFGITLIGFVKSERFNVYTHPERVK